MLFRVKGVRGVQLSKGSAYIIPLAALKSQRYIHI